MLAIKLVHLIAPEALIPLMGTNLEVDDDRSAGAGAGGAAAGGPDADGAEGGGGGGAPAPPAQVAVPDSFWRGVVGKMRLTRQQVADVVAARDVWAAQNAA